MDSKDKGVVLLKLDTAGRIECTDPIDEKYGIGGFDWTLIRVRTNEVRSYHGVGPKLGLRLLFHNDQSCVIR